MRHHRSVLFLVTSLAFFLGLMGCAADSTKSSSEASSPSSVAQAESGKEQPPSREIHERAVPPPSPGSGPHPIMGPTDNITKVANAIAMRHKSLTVLIVVNPGLQLTQPVTISIGFSGYGGTRQTQDYVASTGNHFLYNDPEGNAKPRQAFAAVTLTEPKPGGGLYSFSPPPWNVMLDPLYDVSIGPLAFTLFTGCTLIGNDDIKFSWLSPDKVDHHAEFLTRSGEHTTIPGFAWFRAEASASANLIPPVMSFETPCVTACYIPGAPPLPTTNLVPGIRRQVVTSLEEIRGSCSASAQYNITYTLRWYPYL